MTWLNGAEVASLAMLRRASEEERKRLNIDRIRAGFRSEHARRLVDHIIAETEPDDEADRRALAALEVVAG